MSPVKEPGFFSAEIRPQTLSEPVRRHVALQSRSLVAVLDDDEPCKPYGSIAGEWDDYLRLFRAANGARDRRGHAGISVVRNGGGPTFAPVCPKRRSS